MIKNIARRKKIIRGTVERPRLLVYRSNKTIYGQIIDDINNKTLLTVSGFSPELKETLTSASNKVEASKIIGRTVAEKAKALNINKVVFDRNGYLYHGRVKALADGAREGGLDF
jgi:large subunit ribosomal protein L18